MTPTELRKQLVKSLSTAQVESVDNNGEAVIEHEADRLLQLITADRKRVALEARIEENKRWLTVLAPSMDENVAYNSDFHHRITELKAQQDEV